MITVPNSAEMREHLLALMRGVNAQIFSGLGNQVINGPFRGMWIPEHPRWEDGNASTKLIGCYEFEIHDVVDKAIARRPDVVINVGCAEGYYAVGLARALPEATVYACDLDPDCLECCRESATRNGVEHRVMLGQGCTQAYELEIEAPGKRLYFLDCEAAEINLLNPAGCPSLLTSDIIVECHDFLRPDISSTLAARFEETHDVELITPELPRLDWPPFQQVNKHPAIMAVMAIVEKRPLPTAWLACWAK